MDCFVAALLAMTANGYFALQQFTKTRSKDPFQTPPANGQWPFAGLLSIRSAGIQGFRSRARRAPQKERGGVTCVN